MNERTATLLNNYAKETGRTRKDVKGWWKILVDEDKARSRKEMTTVVDGSRKERKDRAAKAALGKK